MKTTPEMLPWDTNFLGFPVARLQAVDLNSSELDWVLSYCRSSGIHLLYLYASADDVITAAAVQKVQLYLADHRLTFSLPASSAPATSQKTSYHLRQAIHLTNDLEALALQSGAYSRFARDPRFASDVFPRLYKQWLNNTLAAGKVLVAETSDGILQGFLALADQVAYTSIELIAVAAAHRNQGLGQTLLAAAQRHAAARDYAAVQVVTQADNAPAVRLYRNFGFRLIREQHLYHVWL